MSKNIKEKKGDYDSHFSNIAKQSTINFIGRIVHMGFSFIIDVFLARVLGPVFLGRYRLGTTIVNFTSNFTKIGFDQGFIRYIPIYKNKNQFGKIKYLITLSYLISLLLSITVGVMLFFGADFLAINFFNESEMSMVLKLSSILLVVFTFYRLSNSILTAIKRVDYLTIINYIVVPIAFLLPLVTYETMNLIQAFWLRIASYSLGIFLMVFIVYNKEKFMYANYKKVNFTKYMKFSIPLLFINLLYFLISNIDILMIGYFLTSKDVGIYSVSVRISMITLFVLRSINSIFGPVISELVSQNKINELEKLLKSINKIIFLFSFNYLVFVFIFRKEILLVFGEEFILSNIVLVILTFGQFAKSVSGPIGTVLIMSGKQKYEVWNSVLICILNIILNLLFIPSYGIVGAALATMLSIVIINIIKILEIYKEFKFVPYKKSIFKVFLFGLVSFLFLQILSFLDINYLIKLLSGVVLSLFINTWLFVKFGIEKDDQLIINKFKSKFL